MRIACYVTKATDTHSEYVIIIALPRQQWLSERDSVSHQMYSTLPILLNPSLLPCTLSWRGA
jgi:hypothetical protein